MSGVAVNADTTIRSTGLGFGSPSTARRNGGAGRWLKPRRLFLFLMAGFSVLGLAALTFIRSRDRLGVTGTPTSDLRADHSIQLTGQRPDIHITGNTFKRTRVTNAARHITSM